MSQKRKPREEADSRFRVTLPDSAEAIDVPARLPLLPLRDVVVFPHARLPLFVGRPASVAALEEASARMGRTARWASAGPFPTGGC